MSATVRKVQATAPADHRRPLPADVVARAACTSSTHGTPTTPAGGAR
ncbi:hypothetical protein [Actinomadura sp. SCN-SB]